MTTDLEVANVVLVLWLDARSGAKAAENSREDTAIFKTGNPRARNSISCLASVDGGHSKNCWQCQEDIEEGLHLGGCRA